MQTVSTGDRALAEALAKVTLHLYVEGVALAADVISAEYRPSCAGGEALTIGNACAAALSLVLDGGDLGLYGKSVTVRWSVSDTEYDLIRGTVPERPSVSNGQTTVVVYDAMYTSGAGAYTPIDEACTVAEALEDLAGQMGLTLAPLDTAASGLVLETGTAPLTLVSRSQAAGFLAMLLGGNAVISRAGALAVVLYRPQEYAVTSYSAGAAGEESEYTVTGLTIQATVDEQTTEYSAGDGSLMLVNPLGSQEMVDYAFLMLSGVTVHAGTYSIPGGLLLEPGDIITVQTAGGDFSAGCMGLSMALDGGVKTTITSLGDSRSGTGARGVIAQTLDGLKQDLLLTKRLIADYAQVTAADIASLTASQAELGETTMSIQGDLDAVETSLTVAQGEIGGKVSATDYTGAKIASLINQSAEAVTIEAEKINLKGKTIADDFTVTNLTVTGDSTFGGSLSSPSGTIGGWTIGDTALYNGPGTLIDKTTAGTYLGADGIQSNSGDGTYARITNGMLTANSYDDMNDVNVLVQIGGGGNLGIDLSDGSRIAHYHLDSAYVYGPIETCGGDITAFKSSAPRVSVTNNSRKISLYIGTGQINRGIYDDGDGTWLLYRGSSGTIIPDSLSVAGHSTPIGSVLTASITGVTLTTNVGTAVTSITLPAGTWMLVGAVFWPTNTSSYRLACFNTGSGTISYNNAYGSVVAPTPSAMTQQVVTVWSNTSEQTVYLNARQNSGASLTANGYIRAARIA